MTDPGKPTCPTCGSDEPCRREFLPFEGPDGLMPCGNDEFHKQPCASPDSPAEKARSWVITMSKCWGEQGRFDEAVAAIDRAIRAARVEVAEGMHAERCDCCRVHAGWAEACAQCGRAGEQHPATDPRCTADRERIKGGGR